MARNDKEFIIQEYKKVKALGWVKSNRKNNTGIGKTFEDYIGVVENNLEEPDLAGFEIKSHRAEATSYVTLFTKAPNFPNQANAYLNSRFGTPYDDNPGLNKLHTSMFATRFNTYGGKYSFRLINDRAARVLKIGVYDINTHQLIDDRQDIPMRAWTLYCIRNSKTFSTYQQRDVIVDIQKSSTSIMLRYIPIHPWRNYLN